jgi:hypothetical protein
MSIVDMNIELFRDMLINTYPIFNGNVNYSLNGVVSHLPLPVLTHTVKQMEKLNDSLGNVENENLKFRTLDYIIYFTLNLIHEDRL